MSRFFIFSFLFIFISSYSQELNCTVTVNYDIVGNTNNQVYKTLEKSLNDLINKTAWTEREYKQNEKINCSMFITINSTESNNYQASIQVQSSRPIYNSTYSSPILNINDKDFNFSYNEFQNLTYNANSFDSNLISVIAFYCNMIIGMDAESFTTDGGNPYFVTAQDITNLALPSGEKGWLQTEKKQNRYYLVNDLLSNTFKPYREAIYNYHFSGLDLMEKDLKSSKEAVKAAIQSLIEMNSSRPNAYITRVFFDAKADEIVSIFSGGPSINIVDLVEDLNKLSPTNYSKWSQIKF